MEESPSEIMTMKKLFEIEIEGKHFMEKFKLLDTRVDDLKLENNYLREQVSLLTGKVESLEKTNKELREGNDVN